MTKRNNSNDNNAHAELTEIAVILDRSGSMSDIQDDMQGGLWTLITEQHGMPGSCRVSLYEFDDEFEVRFEGRDSVDICANDCRLVPRGMTALNDAVVKALSRLEDRILSLDEALRPEVVSVVVITDGQENASTENATKDARKAIKRAGEKYGWHFTFLAADAGAFADGQAMALGVQGTSVAFCAKEQLGDAAKVYSKKLSEVRSRKAKWVDVTEDSPR